MSAMSSVPCNQYRLCENRWRWFKTKGVTLTLFWSFAVFAVINYYLHFFNINISNKFKSWALSLAMFITTAFFPIAGWLADVYFGRYRVIRACMRILLLGAILLTLELALKPFLPKYIKTVFDVIGILLVCIGLGGFQANIIQFSLDQLFDSSSSEVVSYITFYVLSFITGNLIVKLYSSCIFRNYESIATLLFPTLMTLAVSSDFLFSHWLVKEPVSHNPLKLIFRVLCYAARNKYPRQRSAFTYWEDVQYSRMDLAKRKYGGPFTTEEVENVKTFFQISIIIAVICLFLGLLINTNWMYYVSVSSNFKGISLSSNYMSNTKYPYDCLKMFIVEGGSIIVAIGVPLWEFVLFPFLWRCAMKLKILQRVVLGMLFVSLYLVSRTSFDFYGQIHWQSQNPNATFPCPMSFHTHIHYNLTYWWLVLPSTLYSVGSCFITVAGLEFISAQCPYSMKGLILGMAYLGIGFSVCLFYPLHLPFRSKGFHNMLNLNCMFWYSVTCALVALVIGAVFLVVASRYKNRERDDNSPSQQFLADVYSDHHYRRSYHHNHQLLDGDDEG